MEPVDAVILAGGRSERLNGIVPPYHKPFVVIRGESLVVAAIRHARRQNAERIAVVTCPQIEEPLTQLLSTLPSDTARRVEIITDTNGVGAAVRRGAAAVESDRVLVLMADNIHKDADVDALCLHEYAVGVRVVYTPQARRFTRFVNSRWVEDLDTHSEDDFTEIWCGPLVLDRRRILAVLKPNSPKMGPYLDELVPEPADLRRFPVQSYDIGTPEELGKFTGGWRK